MGRSYEEGDDKPNVRISREELNTYIRLLRYVRPYIKWMVVSVIALLFSVGLGLILPLVIRNLVDLILVDNDLAQLNRLAIGLFLVFILQSVFSFVHRLSLAYVGENAVVDIRVQVYSHLQELSLRFFGDFRTGEVVSRITNDTSMLQAAITEDLVALLRQAITLVGAAALLFWLDWRLTLIILLGVPFITLTMVWLGRKIRIESKAVQDALAKSASVVEETSAGVRIGETSSYSNTLMENSIHSNAGKGIEIVDGAQHGISPPIITSAGCPIISGSNAIPGGVVEIFSDDAEEGRIYEGFAYVDEYGLWSYVGPYQGPNITAVSLKDNKIIISPTGPWSNRYLATDTSEFSYPWWVEGGCYPVYLPMVVK